MAWANSERCDPAPVTSRIGIAQRHPFRVDTENEANQLAVRTGKKKCLWIEVLIQQYTCLKCVERNGIQREGGGPERQKFLSCRI
jgi:hypothetical protein